MSNYVTKDPTFRHFILGLLVFVIIIVVGVFGIRTLFSSNQKDEELAKKDSEVVIKEADKEELAINQTDSDKESDESDQSSSQTETGSETETVAETTNDSVQAAQAEQTEDIDQLTKVGPDSILTKAGLAMLSTYALVYFAKKSF